MKKFIQLGLLAALAGGSVHGNTVSFTNGTTTAAGGVSSLVSNPAGVTVTGYFSNSGTTAWYGASVAQDSLGLGTVGISGLDTSLEGTWHEFLLLDFGATATGSVQINSLVLNYPSNNGTTITPQSPYFKYAWVSGVPTPGNPSAGGITSWTTAGTNATPLTSDLYTFSSLPGRGRYLLIGAVNGSLSTSNYFQLNSLTYTSVPDGASTLALMGAALATLGFAARRRKL